MVASSMVAKDKKLCMVRGCTEKRYKNKRGKVTTQCVCHNIKNYKRNHVNGGTTTLVGGCSGRVAREARSAATRATMTWRRSG